MDEPFEEIYSGRKTQMTSVVKGRKADVLIRRKDSLEVIVDMTFMGYPFDCYFTKNMLVTKGNVKSKGETSTEITLQINCAKEYLLREFDIFVNDEFVA